MVSRLRQLKRRSSMKIKSKYWVLLTLTIAMLTSWVLNLIPTLTGTFTFSLMLVLMLIMILLHYNYLRSLPEPFIIDQPENNTPTIIQRQPVMLIVGPYVNKWFSSVTTGLGTRYSDSQLWLTTSSPEELIRTVNSIKSKEPDTPILAFIPILPDVHESSDLMINELIYWRNKYASTLSTLQLATVVAFYTQMSYGFTANNGESTFWTGVIDSNNLTSLTIDNALLQATVNLQNKPENSLTEIQQLSFIRVFTEWLNESKIKQTIANVISSLDMKLTSILFCDDSSGCSRHGAWSYWLEEHCGLLPATGYSKIKWALPRVIRPLPIAIPAAPAKLGTHPKKYPTILWSIALTLLLLSVNYSIVFVKNRDQIQQIQDEISSIAAYNTLSIPALKQQENKLKSLKKVWLNCQQGSQLANFGLTPCQNIIKIIEKKLSYLSSISYFSTQGAVSIYDSGSSRAKSEAKPLLDKILALAKKHPTSIIRIVGYSDNTGNEKINLSLSQQRAEGIKNWLISEGVSSKQLKTFALGAREPIANNDTPEGRQLNRRVEILIWPPAK